MQTINQNKTTDELIRDFDASIQHLDETLDDFDDPDDAEVLVECLKDLSILAALGRTIPSADLRTLALFLPSLAGRPEARTVAPIIIEICRRFAPRPRVGNFAKIVAWYRDWIRCERMLTSS